MVYRASALGHRIALASKVAAGATYGLKSMYEYSWYTGEPSWVPVTLTRFSILCANSSMRVRGNICAVDATGRRKVRLV